MSLAASGGARRPRQLLLACLCRARASWRPRPRRRAPSPTPPTSRCGGACLPALPGLGRGAAAGAGMGHVSRHVCTARSLPSPPLCAHRRVCAGAGCARLGSRARRRRWSTPSRRVGGGLLVKKKCWVVLRRRAAGCPPLSLPMPHRSAPPRWDDPALQATPTSQSTKRQAAYQPPACEGAGGLQNWHADRGVDGIV